MEPALTSPLRRMLLCSVLVQNGSGEVLIEQSAVTGDWHLPGCGVRGGEGVAEAAKRAMYRQFGLHLPVTHLVGVAQLPSSASESERLHFVLDGGVLDDSEAKTVRVSPTCEELCAWAWRPVQLLSSLLPLPEVELARSAVDATQRGYELPLLTVEGAVELHTAGPPTVRSSGRATLSRE